MQSSLARMGVNGASLAKALVALLKGLDHLSRGGSANHGG